MSAPPSHLFNFLIVDGVFGGATKCLQGSTRQTVQSCQGREPVNFRYLFLEAYCQTNLHSLHSKSSIGNLPAYMLNDVCMMFLFCFFASIPTSHCVSSPSNFVNIITAFEIRAILSLFAMHWRHLAAACSSRGTQLRLV